jgi:copper chaperone CopZ
MLPGTPRTFIGSTTFTVRGPRCACCGSEVADHIGAVPGVTSVTLHRGAGTGTGTGIDASAATVTVSVGRPVDRADIDAAIQQAGYTVLG